jgi:uncharacterized protein (TIGR03086 family)
LSDPGNDDVDLAPLDALKGALAYFGETLALVGEADWDRPVDEWDIRRLVAHVIINDAQISALVRGENVEWTTEVDTSAIGTNAMATWRGVALGLLGALGEAGALVASYSHPLGAATGEQLAGMRVVENLAHGWDLARALSVDRPLPGPLAEWALDFLRPMAGAVLDSEHFGPPIPLGLDADAATRLLALMGRDG